MGKIILPDFGAYRRTDDDRILVTKDIYVEDHESRVFRVAIPPSIPPVFGVLDENEPPKESGWKCATYVRVREPNCEGVALYRLEKVE